MQTNIGLFLAKRARLEPHKTGLIFEGREISYSDWNERANRAAHGFAELGVKPGDRVGLLLLNSPEFLECFFGLAKIGAIVVPLNWRLAPPELSYNIGKTGIRALVYGSEVAELVGSMGDDLGAETCIAVGGDPPVAHHPYEDLLRTQPTEEPRIGAAAGQSLLIMFTSGTTGRPKGAVLTHDNLFFDSCTVSVSLDWRTGDRVLVPLPLFHIGALIYVVIGVHVGATTVLMETFDPTTFLEIVAVHEVNSILAVPSMLSFAMRVPAYEEADLSSVRLVLAGAAPVPVPLIQAWAARGIAIQQVYGLTEAAGGAAVLGAARALEKAGSCGLPMFHTDIRVVEENGHDVPPGEVGELIIRGPHVMREYWRDPKATADTIQDGWLFTGDLARVDEEGYLYIVGRRKDMIISGGENIYPADVENVLAGMEAIAEVAVVGVPDPDWGEAVCAVARLKADRTLTLDQVREHCSGRLGRYKIPKKLLISQEPLPRNPAGKVLKRALRETLR
ncbi:MAG: long-chain fatty acid--CoA ligase [Thermoanaerobaculia bacterium]